MESVKEGTQYESREFQDPPQLPQGRVGQHACTDLVLMSDMVETSWCMFRLVEKGPQNFTIPLLTSGNHTSYSEIGTL